MYSSTKRVHLVLRVLYSDGADRELAFALRQRGGVENLAYSVVASRLSQSQPVQPRSEKHTTGRTTTFFRILTASAVVQLTAWFSRRLPRVLRGVSVIY